MTSHDIKINNIPKTDSLVQALSQLSDKNIASIDEVTLTSVSGGDINQADIVTLPDDRQFFLKRNDSDNFALLQSEVIGLEAIANTGAQTCQPLALGQDNELGFSFLILSTIYTGQATQKSNVNKEDWANLAEQLVTLHQATPPQPSNQSKNQSDSQSDSQSIHHLECQPEQQSKQQSKQRWQAGWFEDNFIGFTPQSNTWMSDWHEFFATQRLQPQIKLAFDNNYLDKTTLSQLERIQQKLEHYLPSYFIKDDGKITDDNKKDDTRPSLLHGDLWAGNALFGYDTLYGSDKNYSSDKNSDSIKGYLIDPAVYVGHPETDIAMTLLFGGFDPHFYEVYAEYLPIEPEFNERQDIYNLYHYLNHLNLFGAGYLSAVKRIAQRFGQ